MTVLREATSPGYSSSRPRYLEDAIVVVHGSFVTRDGVRSPSVRRSGVAGTDAHRPGDGSSRGT